VFKALTLESAIAKRDVLGGTAPRRVREQVERWGKVLG
jgi:argininosuccinate lyase